MDYVTVRINNIRNKESVRYNFMLHYICNTPRIYVNCKVVPVHAMKREV